MKNPLITSSYGTNFKNLHTHFTAGFWYEWCGLIGIKKLELQQITSDKAMLLYAPLKNNDFEHTWFTRTQNSSRKTFKYNRFSNKKKQKQKKIPSW